MKRISATDASRNFSSILNRAKHGGESFLVERNGEPMVEIRPATGPKRTLREFLEFLRATPLPDPDFARDMREIMKEGRRDVGRDPWADDPTVE